MHVSLFKALRSANVAEDTAEQVVHAIEEHIDMAVANAMKHYDDRITAMQTVLEAKLDSGLKNIESGIKGFEGRMTGMDGKIDGLKDSMEGRLTGIETSIKILTWAIGIIGGLVVLGGTIGSLIGGLIKIPH